MKQLVRVITAYSPEDFEERINSVMAEITQPGYEPGMLQIMQPVVHGQAMVFYCAAITYQVYEETPTENVTIAGTLLESSEETTSEYSQGFSDGVESVLRGHRDT